MKTTDISQRESLKDFLERILSDYERKHPEKAAAALKRVIEMKALD
jgi:hypothetical protein